MFVLCVQKAAEEQSGGKPLKRRPEPNYAARSTVKKCTATGAVRHPCHVDMLFVNMTFQYHLNQRELRSM